MSDTPASSDPITLLRTINATAAFNRGCGIEVLSAGEGKAEIAMPWRANERQILVGKVVEPFNPHRRLLASGHAESRVIRVSSDRFLVGNWR